jgi:4-hydroxybutyrate CoA-transferase
MSWAAEYERKLMSGREALRCVESGMRVYIHAGCAEPEVLVEALTERSPFVRNVEVVHLMTMGCAPYVEPEMRGHFRHNAMFIGANVRQAVNDGRADCTPIFLGEVEELFESGQFPIDVALIQVSPPDAHGFCSLGVSVDTTLTAAKQANRVVAQVNDQMPRTYGDCFIHVSELDAIVEASVSLPEMPRAEITEVHRAIARNVASLIDDGACLQTGIGGIPDAVLTSLLDRKDLGMHTEMVSDCVIPLVEAGVINGARKSYMEHKILLSFCLGSRKLFEFVDGNPLFEFRPSRFTNDPLRIARNENMVAINSAVEIDLTGQVCSDSIGQRFYSGFGGQVDFLYGASRSKGGKPIVAIPSTAQGDAVSRIVPMLSPGAGVVTSRALVRYVVTEHGIAYLYGKTVRQRAEALIGVAHPKFREKLYEHCERTRWLQRQGPAALATTAS